MSESIIQLTWESLIPPLTDTFTEHPIYTIGYGGRSIKQFLNLLYRYEITFLIDVRTQPYSRANIHFSKDTLEKQLREAGIRYIFMGDMLGGRPKDRDCYVEGRVDYAKVREQAFFQQGIRRLRTAWEKQARFALMCAEARPQDCHRSKLIGNTLCNQSIEVAHIDEKGELKLQREVNELVLGQQLSLFDDHSLVSASDKMNFSRKRYGVSGGKYGE